MTLSLWISCILLLLGALGGWCIIVMASRCDDEAEKEPARPMSRGVFYGSWFLAGIAFYQAMKWLTLYMEQKP